MFSEFIEAYLCRPVGKKQFQGVCQSSQYRFCRGLNVLWLFCLVCLKGDCNCCADV